MQDRTQGGAPLPKRMLASFSHLREWSDLIKVIFQEIASGSQVTAQLAPERPDTRTPFFCPPCFPKAEIKEQEKSLWGALGSSLYLLEEKDEKGRWGTADGRVPSSWSSRPHSRASRLARRVAFGKWLLAKEPELRLLNQRAASCAGVRGVSGRGPRRHCLKRSVLGGLCGHPGPVFDTCSRSTMAARASPDPCPYRGWEPLNMSCIFNF